MMPNGFLSNIVSLRIVLSSLRVSLKTFLQYFLLSVSHNILVYEYIRQNSHSTMIKNMGFRYEIFYLKNKIRVWNEILRRITK